MPRPVRPGGPPILIAGKQPRMLDLVARHADQWNGAWFGFPEAADELRTRLANLRAAIDAAGRDPTTLTLTAGIHAAFEGADADTPEHAMRGTVDEMAAGLAGYAELGIDHLITHVFPRSVASVNALAEAAARARELVGVARPERPAQDASALVISTWRTGRRVRRSRARFWPTTR